MAGKNKDPSTVHLQSLVESHDCPFVVIDRNYRILAVNKVYEQVYGTARDWVIGGKPCFKISHGNDQPCGLDGEDCPHRHVFETGESYTCLRIHYDSKHRMHQVRVTAYPLSCPDGRMCVGETIEEISEPEDRRRDGHRMLGRTPKFLACMEQLNLAAGSDAPVLMQGETGTGKELAAHFIHKNSARSDKPFLVIDCTVLTESLFEAEVFGHARGAYTGSVGEKQGLFEQADGGTLCLDEIGELPRALQAKLLRVLESGQYRRVGGNKTHKSDVRIICATNRHLWELVLAGQFREDLYYRIACLNIRLPNLRERLDDIPILANNLLELASKAMRRSFHLTEEAIQRLGEYPYPGNIRELRNILFVAATHCTNSEIGADLIEDVIGNIVNTRAQHPDHLVGHGAIYAVPASSAAGVPDSATTTTLQDAEAQHISMLLTSHNSNRKLAAAALGISERTLYRKLKRYALN